MKSLNIGALVLAALFCTAATADQDMMNTQPQGMQTQQDKASNPHIEAREEAKRKHMKMQNEEQWRKDAEQRKQSEMKRPEQSGS